MSLVKRFRNQNINEIINNNKRIPIGRERRTKFELHLMSERKKIETFRLRETKEFLSIDELREKCDYSDHFMEILKVRSGVRRRSADRNLFN